MGIQFIIRGIQGREILIKLIQPTNKDGEVEGRDQDGNSLFKSTMTQVQPPCLTS